ncbi:hypothetical protein [Mycobacterium sp. DBP42]|uniref:hypothetical protein n=1 Tax=Mycobacterium sp. DBP42 TaxID=2545267 RepID=UPI00110C9A42|nr:hypothetical protein [Mycobacterium sp. DBP42]TMS53655.1 hypothetical protein E0T84_10010 [Mycobacterium sp. DBP42]
MYALLESLDPPAEGQTAEAHRERLQRIVDDGVAGLKAFSAAIETLLSRGFKVYSPRRGLRYRIAQERWDRQVDAAKRRLEGDQSSSD